MKYIKSFDIWNPAIAGLIDQGKLQLQSGQVCYRKYKSDITIVDEVRKGYVRAFHGRSYKEAREKYDDYKRTIKARNARRIVSKMLKS